MVERGLVTAHLQLLVTNTLFPARSALTSELAAAVPMAKHQGAQVSKVRS